MLVNGWLTTNCRLTWVKPESILFGSQRNLSKTSDLNVHCNKTRIESKSTVKYLGLQIDQNVSGETMACNVIKKVNCRTK